MQTNVEQHAPEAARRPTDVAADGSHSGPYEPRIVAFLCNWCSYAGADLAGMSRFGYPAAIRVIRVPCSGRVDPMFVLKSFERGADMVLVSGCHPGDCHYTSGNYHARRKLPAFRDLLEFLGIDPRRFKISWVSAAEGAKWSSLVAQITEEARALGPFKTFPACGNGLADPPGRAGLADPPGRAGLASTTNQRGECPDNPGLPAGAEEPMVPR